jgi:hypothetical protein
MMKGLPVWRSSLFVLVAAGVSLLWLAGNVALGSVTGRISGTVKDPTGAVVQGATVTALNVETGLHQAMHTDAQGFYAFPSLPVGHYGLEVQQSGFRDYRQTGLTLDVNAGLLVDVTLQLGAESQHVTVSASAVQVETTNTQMGELITGTKMTTLPLNGRSYTDLLALQPGVVPVNSGQYSSPAVSGGLNPGNLSVSGQRESANGFMVNGGNVEEAGSMGTAIVPNLDSLAEFRILTNNFDAEYGNYSGGQINAVTKSGTNQFHGDAFEFLRNTNLDARNFFSPERGKFIQNQFGGTVGGPILRDKLFFFGDYQGTRQILGQSTGDIAVPSAANRQGIFGPSAFGSISTDPATGKPVFTPNTVSGPYWANLLSQKLGYPVQALEPYTLYDPTTQTSACTSTAQCVFPNGVIPQSAFTVPSVNILKYIPLPNLGPNFSTSAFNGTLRDDKGSIRIDFNSRYGMIAGYYFMDDYVQNSPYETASVPGFNDLNAGRAQMFNLSDTKTFGATLVNEFRIHYMRLGLANGTPSGGLGVTLSSLGFVTGEGTPGIVVQSPSVEGVPPISFNSFSIGVPGYIGSQYNNTYQILDNLSKVKGTHTLKFGGSAHFDQVTHHELGVRNGLFGFTGVETGSDIADFLLGAPAYYNQGAQEALYGRTHYLGLYAQDSWRVSSNLTLNYGLRWEVTTPWSEKRNELETLFAGQQSRVFPGAPAGWDFPGDPGVPNTIAPIRYHDFAPRLGLAYAPTSSRGPLKRLLGASGQTSIRVGFGVFFTAFEGVPEGNIWGDAPFGLYWASLAPPLFTTPFIDRGTGNNEGQRFPVALPPLNVSASNPDNNINWAKFLPISGSPTTWHNNRVPYAEDYSFSIQRRLGNASILSVSYVGTQGHALLSSLESNPGNPALCLSLTQPVPCGPFSENGVYTAANGTTVNSTRAPFGPNFGSNQYFITMGNSAYNSLQASLRHTSGPLELLAGYTYSKSIDQASGYEDNVNPLNYRLSRVLSSFDMMHNFVLSYRYELPFAHFFGPHRAASGWVITGIDRFSTGLPVTLSESDDHSLLGVYYGASIDLPNYTPGRLQYNNPRSGMPYFNASLFSQEAIGQLGTAARRFFHGPGLNDWDMALLKDTHLTESKVLQLRFEFFNIFNHAQFGTPVGNINNTTLFGYVTSANDPRIGQVALKLLF